MLFQRRFHDGIRDGSVTLTFRAWRSARVTPGRRYRLAPHGTLEVDAVEPVKLGAIGGRDARRAGFADAAELVELLQASSRRRLTAASRVFRVSFRYLGDREDPRTALQADVLPTALAEVVAKLEAIDRRSRRGPWTREVLDLLAANPRVAASRLAPRLGRETRAFKADVRRLKALGLTISHEIGYELSPRGLAVLHRLRSPTARNP